VIALLLVTIVLQGPIRSTEVTVPGADIKLRVGWRLLVQGGCRYSVPSTWRSTGGPVSAPDGSTVSVQAIHSENWPTYRTELRRSTGIAEVHEDSDSRLWIEFRYEGLHEHYIAVPAPGAICAAVLELRDVSSRDQELMRGIAESIGPAPAKWPPTER
jgi:hypothetical protein